MPNIENDGYRVFMQEPIDYTDILHTLCHQGVMWKTKDDGEILNFKVTYLKIDYMSWFLLITARIMPSGHISHVTKDRASWIYCIMKVKSVDIGKLVQASILHVARGKTTLGMPHSSVITYLCQYSEFTWDDSFE